MSYRVDVHRTTKGVAQSTVIEDNEFIVGMAKQHDGWRINETLRPGKAELTLDFENSASADMFVEDMNALGGNFEITRH